MDSAVVTKLIQLALEEDLGELGDITTEALISQNLQGEAELLARETLVVCGQEVAEEVFKAVSPELKLTILEPDGSLVKENTPIAVISGPMAAILTAERTALNFLQRLSGIATAARRIVESVKGQGAEGREVKILDTRKTTPGWRELEKRAVAVGGAVNHRKGLYDAFLIKNNHIDALGGDIESAVRKCKEKAAEISAENRPSVQVEVRSMDELKGALSAEPDKILLDNMSAGALGGAVHFISTQEGHEHIMLEASGGITEENVVVYAKTGVHAISLGALTHSPRSADISLRYRDK